MNHSLIFILILPSEKKCVAVRRLLQGPKLLISCDRGDDTQNLMSTSVRVAVGYNCINHFTLSKCFLLGFQCPGLGWQSPSILHKRGVNVIVCVLTSPLDDVAEPHSHWRWRMWELGWHCTVLQEQQGIITFHLNKLLVFWVSVMFD